MAIPVNVFELSQSHVYSMIKLTYSFCYPIIFSFSATMVDIGLVQCSYCVAEGGSVNVVVSRGADGLGDVTFGKNI